jgi:septum formation inhibitor MinC
LRQEEEKRKARLARFGGGGETTSSSSLNENGNGNVNEVEEAKKKRAERFGVAIDQDQQQQEKLNKSLDLLDKPLGSKNRRERKPKKDTAPTSKSNPTNEKTVAQKIGNSAAAAEPAAALAAADPELQKR